VSGQLDQGFGSALMRMMAAAPGHVTINSGARTNAEQAALYAKDPSLAAKPGSSWHERGLAADLAFADDNTKRWAHAHAGEFGLFFPMSWEPWHIQPIWTQGRRATQDGQVADSFTPARPGDPVATDGAADADPLGTLLGTLTSALTGPTNFESDHTFDNALGTFTGIFGADQATQQTGGASGAGNLSGTQPVSGATKVNYDTAYNLLISNGATPSEAHILAAVAGPESGYNTHAHNPNAATGDDSYGLWQINMLGNMGPARRKTFGIMSNDDLFDPNINARAAVSILRSQGLGAWTGYKSGAYRKYLPQNNQSRAF
jgi:hypothetical protein